MRVSVLLVDDEEVNHLLVERSLRGWRADGDLRLVRASDPEEALVEAQREGFHVALVDLHYGSDDPQGFRLIQQLRDLDPALEILVVSSSNRFESVQEAMRAGASDYIAKGFGPAELRHSLDRALARRRWQSIERRASAPREGSGSVRLVGISGAMEKLRAELRRFAPSQAPVLLEGETGSGKEVAARSLHQWGRDPAGAFVPVNCAAVPASTADSFFFGHERGAYTGADRAQGGVFEEADGGTLFLDEVNSLPLDLQGRLLRVLQEREVRRLGSQRTRPVEFRLVTATNQPLEELVRAGKFREDLYFRLAVLKVKLPPLRERADDLPYLAAAFLPGRKLDPSLRDWLQGYAWPGNVRELRNLLLAMDALTPPGEVLTRASVPSHALRQLKAVETAEGAELDPQDFRAEQGSRERAFLLKAYRGSGGNVSRLARQLGVDRSHLHQKLVKQGIHRPRA